jgi:hypothetical protein
LPTCWAPKARNGQPPGRSRTQRVGAFHERSWIGLYRIYFDEVGNHDLVHTDDPNERNLSLTGVIVESGHTLHVIQPEMEQVKR